jgi:hypothetical protein
MKFIKLNQISQKGPQPILVNPMQIVMLEEEKSPGLVQNGAKSKLSFATGGHIVITEAMADVEKLLSDAK